MNPLTRVLVAVDGTPRASVALRLASVLARASRAELLLVRVVPGYATDPARTTAALDDLEAMAGELAAAGLRVRTVVARGDPVAAALLGEIELHRPDLVVLATHGRVGVERAVLGSVSQALLAHSPVPIVVLRPDGRRVEHVATFIVPVDGSPAADEAVATARGLATTFGARAVVLRVVPAVELYMGRWDLGPAREVEEVRADAQAAVDRLVRSLQEAGVAAEGRVEMGQPAPTISAVADAVGADLVIMPTHGRTGLARALLGSVADAVVRTAACPVLLLPMRTRRAGAASGGPSAARAGAGR